MVFRADASLVESALISCLRLLASAAVAAWTAGNEGSMLANARLDPRQCKLPPPSLIHSTRNLHLLAVSELLLPSPFKQLSSLDLFPVATLSVEDEAWALLLSGQLNLRNPKAPVVGDL
eukprot:6181466-Pleurochrysis_carterae.AAC.1